MTAALDVPPVRTRAGRTGGLRRLPFLLPLGLAVLAVTDAALMLLGLPAPRAAWSTWRSSGPSGPTRWCSTATRTSSTGSRSRHAPANGSGWVLDAGPNRSTSFHVVGAQFDTVYAEGGAHGGFAVTD